LKSLRITAFAAVLSLLPMGKPLLLGTLTASTAAIILSASEAQAKDKAKIQRIAKAITVRIEGATQGSGVLVKKKGNRYTVLTAWHVVKDNMPEEEVGIITSDGKEHLWESKTLQRIGNFDIAILTFLSEDNYELAKINIKSDIESDQDIFIAGFPLRDSKNLSLSKGLVIANSNINFGEGYQLLYITKTEAGISGGPALNKNGFLVGIHGRGEYSEVMSQLKAKTSKTGINQGLPVKHYKTFISGKPLLEYKGKLNSQDYLVKARHLSISQGMSEEVKRLAQKSLDLEPNFWGYYLILTSSDSDLSKANQKERDLKIKKALDLPIKNNNYLIHYSRAILFTLLEIGTPYKYYNQSIEELTKAIKLNSECSLCYSTRGVSKSFLGDKKGALADYDRAINLNPLDAQSYIYRATIYTYDKDLKNYDSAIDNWTSYLEIFPGDIQGYFSRGKVKAMQDKHLQAIDDFKIAINLFETEYKPTELTKYMPFIMVSIYESKAESKKKTGKDEDAINVYTKLIRYISNLSKEISNEQSRTYYSRAYGKRGDLHLAIGNLKGACSDFKNAILYGNYQKEFYLDREEGAWCRNMPD